MSSSKKRTLKSAKARAWKVFSLWVRTKDADPAGYVQCVCCGQVVHYKESHAGHYIHGKTKPSYFEEKNVHVSCVRCNLHMSGNLTQYALYLEGRYGEGILQELDILSKSGEIWNIAKCDAVYDYYKEKLNEQS